MDSRFLHKRIGLPAKEYFAIIRIQKGVENPVLYKCIVEGIANWSDFAILFELFSTPCYLPDEIWNIFA